MMGTEAIDIVAMLFIIRITKDTSAYPLSTRNYKRSNKKQYKDPVEYRAENELF